MKIYKYVVEKPITKDYTFGENGSFNIETLELNYKDEFRKLLNCPNPLRDGNALDQIVLTGHYLYSRNDQFRQAWLEANNKIDWQVENKDLQRFVLKNIFNLFLYGLVVDKYIQSLPEKPRYFMTRSVDNRVNKDLSNYSKEYLAKTGKPFFYKVGCPFYCYYKDESKIIRRKPINTTNYSGTSESNTLSLSDIVICPISSLIPRMKELSKQINYFANIVYDETFNTIDSELKETYLAFKDPSWNQYLEIEK